MLLNQRKRRGGEIILRACFVPGSKPSSIDNSITNVLDGSFATIEQLGDKAGFA